MQENSKEKFNINERIVQIVDYYNLTRYKFSQETGISDAVLFNIYKGKNKPSFDLIEKILNKYKLIDANWLLTGEGEMFKEECSSHSVEEPESLYKKDTTSVNSTKHILKKDLPPIHTPSILKQSNDEHTVSINLLNKIIELSSENALLKKELSDLKGHTAL
jgi:transcriptional regulator with XRE-family HTH domain